jgi:hypothetical protein
MFKAGCPKRALIFVFLLCALPTGAMMAMLTPLGEVPDESAHVERAAGLLRGAVLAVRRDEPDLVTGRLVPHVGVKIDLALRRVMMPHVTMINGRPVFTLADRVAVLSEADTHDLGFVSIPNTATYFPVPYLPATGGLAVGQMIHASPYQSLILARAGMLVGFLGLGTASLWLAAGGEGYLLAVLLLPMTLFLAGSANQDGMLIGMSCLAVAGLSRVGLWRALGILMLVLFLMCKPPYLPLLGFLLLPLKRAGFLRRAGEIGLAAVPVLLWVVVLAAFVVVPLDRLPFHPGPLWTGDPSVLLDRTDAGGNLRILLARPLWFFALPWAAVTTGGIQDVHAMIGSLGLLAIQFSESYYRCWEVALAAGLMGALAATALSRSVWRIFATALFAVTLLVATSWAVMISLYLNWTNLGDDFIDGIQGRYLIPLLPFLLLVCPVKWYGGWRVSLACALPAVVLGIYDIGFLPLKLVTFFYAY